MNFKSLALVAIVSLSAIPLIPNAARADDCKKARDAVSYIEIPGARCFDLKYLTVIGQSRDDLKNAAYLNYLAVEINKSRPDVTYSTTVGTKNNYVSNSTTISDNPTPEERAERKQILEKTNDNLREATASNQYLESLVFRRHTQVMDAVSGSLVTPRR